MRHKKILLKYFCQVLRDGPLFCFLARARAGRAQQKQLKKIGERGPYKNFVHQKIMHNFDVRKKKLMSKKIAQPPSP